MNRNNKDSTKHPLCDCGCGQLVARSKVTGEWNKFILGHNSRSALNSGRFKPGNQFSKGRPEGSRNRVSISAMNLLKDEEQALSRRAIDSALNGNVQMLQFCLSRILPPPPKDVPVKLDGMPECKDIKSAIPLSSFIIEKIADSTLTPNQAHLISGVVERHLRCMQLSDVEERLSLLELKLDEQRNF